jgi:hypothetical protein
VGSKGVLEGTGAHFFELGVDGCGEERDEEEVCEPHDDVGLGDLVGEA